MDAEAFVEPIFIAQSAREHEDHSQDNDEQAGEQKDNNKQAAGTHG
jgi:hypothetical protein